MNFYAVALWVVFSATCVGAAHPGQCPTVDRDVGGICVEECSSDADCLSYQKCCSNGCGHACTIVKQPRIGLKLRPRCPPVDDDTIGPCLEECSSDDQCEVGKLCCSNGCGHACTALMETPAKPGRCPAGEELQSTVGICLEECRTDGDCEGDMKCCSNGCGHTCTQPVRTNTTKPGQCPKVPLDSFGTCSENCTSDGDCPGKQKCCSNGCGHACAGPFQPKEGTCPKVPEDSAGICSEDCSSDADCLGQKKCCSNGCGHACRDPAPTAPKPGYCPVIQTGSVGICNEDCIADANCPGSQRCCSNGCGHVCMEPVEEKANNSGQCPRVDSEVGGICLEECSSDNECENAQRCCSNGCGHVCMDTTTEIQQETGCRLGENYYRDGEQVFTSEECTICYCRVGELKCKIVDGCQRETTIYMAIIIPVILTAVGIIISLSLLIVIVRCFILRKPSRRLRYKLMHEVPEFEPVPGAATRNDGYTL